MSVNALPPFFFLINVIDSVGLFRASICAQNIEARTAIMSYAIFELYHGLSKTNMFNEKQKIFMAHFYGYLTILSTYQFLRSVTRYSFNIKEKLALGALILFDFLVLGFWGGIFSVVSGSFMMAVICFLHVRFFNMFLKKMFILICTSSLVIFGFFCIETWFLEELLRHGFHFHSIVSTLGTVFMFALMAQFINHIEQTR